jgi:hypothetical protein
VVIKWYVAQMGIEGVNWVHLAQERDKRSCLVNITINLPVCEIEGFCCEAEGNLALLGFIQRRYRKTLTDMKPVGVTLLCRY